MEMGSNGIVSSKCKEAANGDNAYLLRLNPERTAAPLLAAAKEYLDEKVYYDYPDLVFFAGLIIFRAVRSTKRWQKIMDYILESACVELDKMLNKMIHKDGKKPSGLHGCRFYRMDLLYSGTSAPVAQLCGKDNDF